MNQNGQTIAYSPFPIPSPHDSTFSVNPTLMNQNGQTIAYSPFPIPSPHDSTFSVTPNSPN